MVPWPVMTMTTTSGSSRRIVSRTTMPSIPGMIRSSSTIAGGSSRQSRRASWPRSATDTWKPSERSRSPSASQKSGSSSTSRMRDGGAMASTSVSAERLRRQAQELAGVEGLQHEVVRAAGAALVAERAIVRSGQHGHAGWGGGPPESRQDLEAAEPRHLEVEDDAAGPAVAHTCEGLEPVLRGDDLIAGGGQSIRDDLEQVGLIVDHQDEAV